MTPEFRKTAEASVIKRGYFDLSEVAASVDIVQVIGMFVPLKPRGHEFVGQCPFHADRSPSFTVARHLGANGRFKCFPCGAGGDVIDFVRKIKNCDHRTAVRFLKGDETMAFLDADRARLRKEAEAKKRRDDEDAEKRRQRAAQDWEKRKPSAGSPVEAYLRARKVRGDVSAVGYDPQLYCAEVGRDGPAMIAAMVGARGEFLALHRTWLARSRDGMWRKAALQQPKKILGRFMGGHIAIHGMVTPGCDLYVAEGIETAFSVRDGLVAAPELAANAAVWAAGSLANLSRLALPSTDLGKPLPRRIILCMDADMADPALARTEELNAELQYGERGVEVLVAYPPAGMDFNDLAQAAAFDRRGACTLSGEVAAE